MLLNKNSNHGLPPYLEVQFFYKGLHPNMKMIIDTAAGGVLMSKNLEEARNLLDEMSSNHYQWLPSRGPAKKIAWVHELDTLSSIQAQLAVITNQLGAAIVSSFQTNLSCEFCGGGMKAITINMVVLPLSKLSKQIISIIIKGRTTPTLTHIIQDGGTTQIYNKETTWGQTFSRISNNNSNNVNNNKERRNKNGKKR